MSLDDATLNQPELKILDLLLRRDRNGHRDQIARRGGDGVEVSQLLNTKLVASGRYLLERKFSVWSGFRCGIAGLSTRALGLERHIHFGQRVGGTTQQHDTVNASCLNGRLPAG